MGRPSESLERAVTVGENIRQLRAAAGLTLKQLAAKSGVSIATISKIENGKISGGFETIYKIARGLGVLVTEIIADRSNDDPAVVVHEGNGRDVHKTELYDYYPQAFHTDGLLNTYQMVIHTRHVPDVRDWSIHDGEEVIVVLSGSIDLHVEGLEPHRLDAGDSACFESGARHAFVAIGDSSARILSVSTRGPLTRVGGRLIFSRSPDLPEQ